jgi:hypothetical protein
LIMLFRGKEVAPPAGRISFVPASIVIHGNETEHLLRQVYGS